MKQKLAPWYTEERWQKADVEDAAFYKEEFGYRPTRMICKSKDDTLFSKGRYPTKRKADDLPPAFIRARIGKLFGYYDASAVVGAVYEPNEWINHLFRDDLLYLSFSNASIDPKDWESFDIVLSGWDIIAGVAALDAYSNISKSVTTTLQDEIAAKVRLYNKTHPHEHDCINEDTFWEHMEEAKLKVRSAKQLTANTKKRKAGAHYP